MIRLPTSRFRTVIWATNWRLWYSWRTGAAARIFSIMPTAARLICAMEREKCSSIPVGIWLMLKLSGGKRPPWRLVSPNGRKRRGGFSFTSPRPDRSGRRPERWPPGGSCSVYREKPLLLKWIPESGMVRRAETRRRPARSQQVILRKQG